MLGNFMYLAGVYKILYNPDYHVKCKPDGEVICRDKEKWAKPYFLRKDKELEFHINLWRILKRSNMEFIDCVILLELLILLFDTSQEPIKELAAYTEGIIDQIN